MVSRPEDAAEVVARAYGAFARGDIAEVRRAVHPELRFSSPASLPWGGVTVGFEPFLGAVQQRSALLEVTAGSQDVHPWGEQVVLLMASRFRARATGRSLDTRIVEVVSLSDGLISGIDLFYEDTDALLGLLA